jgi:predicted metalloprotease with PDZ domain
MGLEWNTVALYYAGFPTRLEIYRPTLVIPAGWGYASALKTQERSGGRISFTANPFNTLVDSPVIAGKYFREIDVTASPVHRYLDLVGDEASALHLSDAQIADYRRLVGQAQALFQSHHYDDYHFLLTLSDYTSTGGLEHHQSSDDRARSGARMFADADHFMLDASLLPHEYTHSWNGKFMRPAQLWQPDFERPEHDCMLWVYEGLTVYLGDMLTARSGLWSPDTWRQVVAYRRGPMEGGYGGIQLSGRRTAVGRPLPASRQRARADPSRTFERARSVNSGRAERSACGGARIIGEIGRLPSPTRQMIYPALRGACLSVGNDGIESES